jgi:hypothetical protein
MVKSLKRVTVLEISPERQLYTHHGLHLNRLGRELLAKQIANVICKVEGNKTQEQIALKWKVSDIDAVRKTTIDNQDLLKTHDPPSKSTRIKKLTSTRSDDFLW